MKKTVHAYHPETRVYMGPVVLDESDISPLEPGVFQIPAHCIDAEPPKAEAGCFIAADADRWVMLRIPEPPPEPEKPVEPPPPELTLPEIVGQLMGVVDGHLDAQAIAWRYTSIADAISFAVAGNLGVPKYYAEGKAFAVLRSEAWLVAEQIADEVLAGSREAPTALELLHLLPVIDQADIDRYLAEALAERAAAAPSKAAKPATPKKKGG